MLNANLYKNKFENYIFKTLESYYFCKHEECFGVAVSGGPDSMLLLNILDKWVKKKKKSLKIFSFNHNLRPNSINDLIIVENNCKQLGHKFYKIDWYDYPKTAIMEKARIARYEEISKLCKKLDIKTLFTAHHADDIAETVSIRILKKSNIEGLCPIFKVRELFGIKLFRPLIEFKKEEILKLNKINNVEFVNDPSNLNNKYLRTRIRKYLDSNKKLKDYLIKSSILFCKLRNLTNTYIKLNFRNLFNYKFEGYLVINCDVFKKYPKYMVLYFLKYSLKRIGNKSYPAKNKLLDIIYIKCTSNMSFTINLCGCIMSLKKNKLTIFREYKSIVKETFSLNKLDTLIWDTRFKVVNRSNGKIFVLPLGKFINNKIYKKIYKINKKKIKNIPFKARITLPIIKTLEGSICIPHLNIYESKKLNSNIEIHTIDFYDKKYDNMI